jgi:hypothetical protein
MEGSSPPRPITPLSRFDAVHRMPPSVVLAGQVGCPVCLVASCLVGCAWWNDRENDHLSSDRWLVKALDLACRFTIRNAPETDGGHNA